MFVDPPHHGVLHVVESRPTHGKTRLIDVVNGAILRQVEPGQRVQVVRAGIQTKGGRLQEQIGALLRLNLDVEDDLLAVIDCERLGGTRKPDARVWVGADVAQVDDAKAAVLGGRRAGESQRCRRGCDGDKGAGKFELESLSIA